MKTNILTPELLTNLRANKANELVDFLRVPRTEMRYFCGLTGEQVVGNGVFLEGIGWVSTGAYAVLIIRELMNRLPSQETVRAELIAEIANLRESAHAQPSEASPTEEDPAAKFANFVFTPIRELPSQAQIRFYREPVEVEIVPLVDETTKATVDAKAAVAAALPAVTTEPVGNKPFGFTAAPSTSKDKPVAMTIPRSGARMNVMDLPAGSVLTFSHLNEKPDMTGGDFEGVDTDNAPVAGVDLRGVTMVPFRGSLSTNAVPAPDPAIYGEDSDAVRIHKAASSITDYKSAKVFESAMNDLKVPGISSFDEDTTEAEKVFDPAKLDEELLEQERLEYGGDVVDFTLGMKTAHRSGADSVRTISLPGRCLGQQPKDIPR